MLSNFKLTNIYFGYDPTSKSLLIGSNDPEDGKAIAQPFPNPEDLRALGQWIINQANLHQSQFPVIIENSAIEAFTNMFMEVEDPEAFIRIGVKGGGCSGLNYALAIDTETLENDYVLEVRDLAFHCDPISAEHLKGTVLSYVNNPLNLTAGGFKFENPNASRCCGCGSSFTPKED